MPDTFKILHESFSEPAPATEDEGFQDFNALSRIAASEPAAEVPASRFTPVDKGVSPRPVTDQPPSFAATPPIASAHEAVNPVSERVQPTISKPVRATQAELTPRPQSTSPSDIASNEAGWRELPLAELFARLRSRPPSAGEPSRRLHGMFRR